MNNRCVIWGTGEGAEELIENGIPNLIGFIETKRTKETFKGKKVYLPSEILKEQYDAIVISVKRFDYYTEISNTIKILNIKNTISLFLF
ncbi:hypothetical protein [Pseudobutyrivibrio sp.]|uniref:hypothetical protein n=1 Tax=Pseudobutyrivibrio sp. TaxID=2014367 RepID=UPI001DE858E1|nr:hypothetical protein [Pseudobutyrivibrio sp.]MBE5910561.1 hypothetical protein [Pseudobutyrivibrio sp.]